MLGPEKNEPLLGRHERFPSLSVMRPSYRLDTASLSFLVLVFVSWHDKESVEFLFIYKS